MTRSKPIKLYEVEKLKNQEVMEKNQEVENTPEMNTVPEGEVQQTPEQQQLLLDKNTLIHLVREAEPGLPMGIASEVIKSFKDDEKMNFYWFELSQLPWSMLLKGRVNVRWGQKNEDEPPYMVFLFPSIVHLLEGIMDEIVSLSVYEQPLKMKMEDFSEKLPNAHHVLKLMTILYVFATVAVKHISNKDKEAQEKQ